MSAVLEPDDKLEDKHGEGSEERGEKKKERGKRRERTMER
jgi:hypothetical protein